MPMSRKRVKAVSQREKDRRQKQREDSSPFNRDMLPYLEDIQTRRIDIMSMLFGNHGRF